jgi:hypothetical protein
VEGGGGSGEMGDNSAEDRVMPRGWGGGENGSRATALCCGVARGGGGVGLQGEH